jgi:hypothetical protein
MPLSEKELKELKVLENPDVTTHSPVNLAGIVISSVFGSSNKRKERVVELRTKLRTSDLGLDIDKDWKEYYKIRREEEENFDKKFKV